MIAKLFSLMQKKHDLLKQNQRINAFDRMIFYRQFAALFTAGIPILRCLELLELMQNKQLFRIIIYTIKRDLRTGRTLSFCFRLFPEHFDELTCHLIAIGEHIGKLDTMLLKIADSQESQLAFQERIKSALFYPLIILCSAIMITLGLLLFVIPKFAELFAENSTQLPFITLWLFWLSTNIKSYIGYYICIMSIIFLLVRYKQPHIHKKLIRLLTRLPFIQYFFTQMILVRFIKTLALSLSAGISIFEALQLVRSDSAPPHFSFTLQQIRHHISTGTCLHQAMSEYTFFPPLLVQLVKTGEETGLLSEMLEKALYFIESSIERDIKRLSQLIEPLIMAILGILIGGLIISLYLPLFQMGDAFN